MSLPAELARLRDLIKNPSEDCIPATRAEFETRFTSSESANSAIHRHTGRNELVPEIAKKLYGTNLEKLWPWLGSACDDFLPILTDVYTAIVDDNSHVLTTRLRRLTEEIPKTISDETPIPPQTRVGLVETMHQLLKSQSNLQAKLKRLSDESANGLTLQGIIDKLKTELYEPSALDKWSQVMREAWYLYREVHWRVEFLTDHFEKTRLENQDLLEELGSKSLRDDFTADRIITKWKSSNPKQLPEYDGPLSLHHTQYAIWLSGVKSVFSGVFSLEVMFDAVNSSKAAESSVSRGIEYPQDAFSHDFLPTSEGLLGFIKLIHKSLFEAKLKASPYGGVPLPGRWTLDETFRFLQIITEQRQVAAAMCNATARRDNIDLETNGLLTLDKALDKSLLLSRRVLWTLQHVANAYRDGLTLTLRGFQNATMDLLNDLYTGYDDDSVPERIAQLWNYWGQDHHKGFYDCRENIKKNFSAPGYDLDAKLFTTLYSTNYLDKGIGQFDLADPADIVFPYDYESSGRANALVMCRPGSGIVWILAESQPDVWAPVYTCNRTSIGKFDMRDPRDQGLAFDYNSTGKLDHLVFYRPGENIVYIVKRDNLDFTPVYISQPTVEHAKGTGIGGYDLSSSADRMFAFDWNHSGKQDHLCIYRPGGKIFEVIRHDGGGQFRKVCWTQYDGMDGYHITSLDDQAFAFDWTSSGSMDHVVLYRAGYNTFWILRRTGQTFAQVFSSSNGVGGFNFTDRDAKAFAIDWDGSGKLDHIAAYIPGTGTFWCLKRRGDGMEAVMAEGCPGRGIGECGLRSTSDRIFAFNGNRSRVKGGMLIYEPVKEKGGYCWILART